MRKITFYLVFGVILLTISCSTKDLKKENYLEANYTFEEELLNYENSPFKNSSDIEF